jgi:F0F1-type ATP synthase membrane subunit c/vacuolar-type H+-ATPase subunit K
LRHLTVVLILMICTLGPAFVIAVIGYASIQALARNPSASAKIQTSMIMAFVFAEAIAVISILVIFQLFGQ